MVLKSTKLALVFIFCLFSTTNVFAQNETGETARQVVEKFQAELIAVMKNGKQLGLSGRYDKLYGPVTNSHDLTKVARFAAGKEWEQLSEAQQQKWIEAFTRFSVTEYAYNFKEYSGESFVYDSEEETARGGVVVHTRFIESDKTHKFDYNLKKKGNSWRIINILADGSSEFAVRRTEFNTILQREGFDALMAKINEKIDNYSK